MFDIEYSPGMGSSRLYRLAAVIAFLDAVVTFGGICAFDTRSMQWTALSRFLDLFDIIVISPVTTYAFYRLLRVANRKLSLLAAIVAIVWLLLLFVSEVRDIQQGFVETPIILTASAADLLYFVLVGYLGATGRILPLGLVWLGIGAAAGYLFLNLVIWRAGLSNPGVLTIWVIITLASTAWAIWLGTLFWELSESALVLRPVQQ